MPKTIVLTGGGTAGHITPNLALIPFLLERGWEVHYIGSRAGMERELAGSLPGVEYHAISSGKLRRYLDLKNFSDPFRVLAGTAQAYGILRRLRPRVVFSKGGFVSVPVAYAARLARVPMVLHESDLSPGLANRLAMPSAARVCTTFPETAALLGPKARHTGTPIRRELFSGDARKGLKLCGFAGAGLPVMLMMGGSQGAASVNAALRQALPKLLKSFRVIHICGKGNVDAALAGTKGYAQFEYVGEGLADLLAAAGLVVSRAGANSIFEFLALKKPMLLIPLPLSASRGDQIENAKSFASHGFACVLDQDGMTPDSLYDAILNAWARRDGMKRAMEAHARADGTTAVLEEIEKAAITE
jgi:UDP-N-acetylglucosamine--N-acetylmuramyl-(pentapeptide) pyrophosphoryl-undecaprenol N-acetylglucosamine transferase